jgi:hypothetical protein
MNGLIRDATGLGVMIGIVAAVNLWSGLLAL